MNDYETLDKIGDGTFGTVYLCRRRQNQSTSTTAVNSSGYSRQASDDDLVAIKRMKKRYYNWDECMKLREIKALKKLYHDNIVLLKEVIRENNQLYLVFEHMEENLYQLIRSQTLPFQEVTIKQMIKQILSGLNYIHVNGFFHRDIKPENLLCRDRGKLIKIADFGLTRESNSEPPFTDYVSTRWYRAPELLLHSKNYNYTIDMWALGCIMGELYTLQPMFPGRSEIDQIFKICQIIGAPDVFDWEEGQRLASLIQFNFPNIVPLKMDDLLMDSNCSSDGLMIIKSLLQWSPNNRPDAKELLKHTYIKS